MIVTIYIEEIPQEKQDYVKIFIEKPEKCPCCQTVIGYKLEEKLITWDKYLKYKEKFEILNN